MEQSLVNDIALQLANGKALNTDIPTALVSENFQVASLESYQKVPVRIRQAVELKSETALIDYVIDILLRPKGRGFLLAPTLCVGYSRWVLAADLY